MVQNPILLLVSIASFLTVNTQHATLQPFNPSILQPFNRNRTTTATMTPACGFIEDLFGHVAMFQNLRIERSTNRTSWTLVWLVDLETAPATK